MATTLKEEKQKAMELNPNQFIIDKFNEIKLVNDVLKETRLEIKERQNQDDEMLDLMNLYEEKKEELKPIMENLKAKKEEFKVKNINFFNKEDSLKKQILELKEEVVAASIYKKNIKDETPIIVGEGSLQRQLVIGLVPKMKKEKM